MSRLALAAMLAGCAADRSGGAGQAQGQDPVCDGRALSAGVIRAGDNIPVSLHVRNNGRRCWWGLRMSNQSMLASDVVNRPSHGDAILHVDQNVVAFGYLPNPGYAGPDDFLIELPTDVGNHTNLAVTVRVLP